MGGFLTRIGLRKPKTRILLLGLDSAGKTTTLYQLKLGDLTETVPTIGFNVETVQHKKFTMNVWDVGGQDQLRPLWRHYYTGTSGIVFIVDSQDRSRFDKAKTELQFLMHEVELKNACVCVLANKQDLPGSATPEEVEEALDLKSIPNAHTIISTVARENKGLTEALDWLADHVEAY